MTAEGARGIIAELDQTVVDWSDIETGGRQTRKLARALAEDKTALRDLVFGVEDDPELLSKCERHELLDYIVIYDALPRGFRIRLNLSTKVHVERPHDHRFSFSSFIVRGGYRHTCYELDRALYERRDDATKAWITKASPDPRREIQSTEMRPLVVRMQHAGDCYTLHHTAIHATRTTPDTVSIFVRGPAEKPYSLIYDAETERYWWRWGAHAETPERRSDKRMTLQEYREFRQRMIALGVI